MVEPGLSGMASFAKRFGFVDFSLDQLDLFVHGRVVDVSALAEEFGFEPRPTAVVFDEFIKGQGFGPLGPDRVRAAEQAILERIRQVRS